MGVRVYRLIEFEDRLPHVFTSHSSQHIYIYIYKNTLHVYEELRTRRGYLSSCTYIHGPGSAYTCTTAEHVGTYYKLGRKDRPRGTTERALVKIYTFVYKHNFFSSTRGDHTPATLQLAEITPSVLL